MRYTKPHLSFEQQADLIIQRGLIADKSELINIIKSVNYYRLSAYLYPFRSPGSGDYIAGTTLETIWRRYTFDRHLRLNIIDAIERIEVSIRTHCATNFSRDNGTFGYLEHSNLPKINKEKHELFLKKLSEETNRSREKFKKHFFNKYGDTHKNLPLWMAVEVMSFGMMLTLYNGLEVKLKQEIAAQYNVSDTILSSWLLTLNVIRNICAHHGRLWNREIGCKPSIPKNKKHPEWHLPIKVCSNRIFGVLTILKFMLNKVAPQSKWPARLIELLNEYKEIPRDQMGFEKTWEECPIWKV